MSDLDGDLEVKRQAIEKIISASFRAGFEFGQHFTKPVDPIIEWDGPKPRIAGYKVPD